MNKKDIAEKLNKLKRIVKENKDAFPDDDFIRLLKKCSLNDDDFIPKLDLFESNIRGYCTCGENILEWSDSKIDEVKKQIEFSFFEKHPEYSFLIKEIETNFPKITYDLQKTEDLRTSLIGLLKDCQMDKSP